MCVRTVEGIVPWSEDVNNHMMLSAGWYIDIHIIDLRATIVYSLRGVRYLTHEHFGQCSL